jgi:YD repeat-containing protein
MGALKRVMRHARGLILDYDKSGRLVSIELLDASEHVTSPQTVEFALAAAH